MPFHRVAEERLRHADLCDFWSDPELRIVPNDLDSTTSESHHVAPDADDCPPVAVTPGVSTFLHEQFPLKYWKKIMPQNVQKRNTEYFSVRYSGRRCGTYKKRGPRTSVKGPRSHRAALSSA